VSDFGQRTRAKAAESSKPRRSIARRTPVAALGPTPAFNALGTLHAWGGNGAVSSLLGTGAPLAETTRREFEQRFGASFADVRIHDDSIAHARADSFDANAYTVGSHIVFSRNRFAPDAFGGKRLLAHELAHVIQQRRGGAAPALDSNAPHEHGADAAASAFASGASTIAVQGATAVGVARDEKKKPQQYDFYEVALGGNRMYRWGIGGVKTPKGWPGDDKLKDLWDSLGIPATKPAKQVVDDHKLAHEPAFVKFVDSVRDFQSSVMGRKGTGNTGANGIVDTETARRLGEAQAAARKADEEKQAAKEKVAKEAADKKAKEDAAKLAVSGTLTVKGSASGTVNAASSGLFGLAFDPEGAALDYMLGEFKERLVDAVLQGIGLPTTGSRIVASLAKGMGEQIATELIDNGKGRKFLNHLSDFKTADVGELYKGYLWGLGRGLVSPVTDLWGLVEFGESAQKMFNDLLASAFNNAGNFDKELHELIAEAGNLYKYLVDLWDDVKNNKVRTLVALLNAPQALSQKAVDLAYDLGKRAGTAIVDGLEDPWRAPKEEAAPDPLQLPAAYVSYMAKKGEDWLIDTPWAKVGFKVGYGIGWVAIQVILLVFTEGIGDAITQVSEALSKAAAFVGKFSKAAGKVATEIAEFLEWIGKGASAAEKLFGEAIEKIAEKLPFLKKILGPLGKFFEKLQKFLRKLFGVVEKDGALLLEEAAAKAAPKIGEDLPKPPPKPPQVTGKGKPLSGTGAARESEDALGAAPKGKGGGSSTHEPSQHPPSKTADPHPVAAADEGAAKGSAKGHAKDEPAAKPSADDKPNAASKQDPKSATKKQTKKKGGDASAKDKGKSQKAGGAGKGSEKDAPKVNAKPKKEPKPAKPQAKANNKGQGTAKPGAAAGGKGATADAFESRLKALKVPPDKQKAFDEAAKQVRKLAAKDPAAAERMMEGLEERFAPRAPGKSGVQDIFDEAQGKVYPEKGPSGKHTQSTAADERALQDQDKPSRKRVRQDRNKESEKLGEAGGREVAEKDGIKISDWDTPQQWKGDFGRGIDRIGTRADKTVILEWKYGGSGLSKAGDGTVQMSNEWVGKKIAELQAVGDTETADALLKALDEGKLQGAVYKTRPLKAGEETSRLRSSQLRDKLSNENISEAGLISYSRTKVRAAYQKRLAELKAAIERGDLKGLKNL
jgi:hypothetical protein